MKYSQMCVCLLGREGEVMSDVTSAGELQCVEEEIKVRERGSGDYSVCGEQGSPWWRVRWAMQYTF